MKKDADSRDSGKKTAEKIYIYIILNILTTVWPFLLFMVVIIVAFAHTT